MKTILFLFASTICFSQTISKAPIYEGANSFKIHEAEYGFIHFLGEDSEDKNRLLSFSIGYKKNAIKLIEKAIFILSMEQTRLDRNITDKFQSIRLARYGCDQKRIHFNWNALGNYLSFNPFNLQELKNIKTALENYKYSSKINN